MNEHKKPNENIIKTISKIEKDIAECEFFISRYKRELIEVKKYLNPKYVDLKIKECSTYKELQSIGVAMGYKEGWAYYQAKKMNIPIPNNPKNFGYYGYNDDYEYGDMVYGW